MPNSKVKLRAGANLVKIRPVFSFDSKHLLAASGNDVKVFSISSGECIQNLKGHKMPVIALQINPWNHVQVLSCSEDGIVFQWDYADGTALKSYNLKVATPVMTFYAPYARSPWFITTKLNGTEFHRLYSVKMKKSKAVRKKMVFKEVLPYQENIAFGVEGLYVASVFGNELKVNDFSTHRFKCHKTGTRDLVCVACHPYDYVVATGDNTGRILVWRDFFETNYPHRSIYHWHTLPVADIAFSTEGSYIYSCGGECALVKWKIDSENRHILPRLGLPICHFAASPDNSFVVTAHVDNALQVINPQNKIVQIIQGLTKGHLHSEVERKNNRSIIPTGMLYDPRTKALIMNGKPGHLQFYQVDEDKQLFNLDIVGENYLSQERNKRIVNTEVEKAAIDYKGTWLATVEWRDDGETSPEIYLKFWQFDSISQKFVLNTNIILAHYQKINCLKFCPPPEIDKHEYQPMAVTTSDDKCFKIWTLVDNTDIYQEKSTWDCDSIGCYRELSAGDACFSQDGSLLAVVFGHVVTLWTPESTNLKDTLCNPRTRNSIQQVLFGWETCSHLLVCHTKTALMVWNVLTLSVFWTVKCNVQYIARDPQSDIMAAFSDNQNLFIFRPSNPKPIFTQKTVSKTPIVAALFVPYPSSVSTFQDSEELSWQKCSQLYFLNQEQELLTITDEPEEDLESIFAEKMKINKYVSNTPFGLLLAEHSTTGVKTMKHEIHLSQGIAGLKEVKEIIEVPSHVLPPVSRLCSNFISSLLILKDSKKANMKEDHISDIENSDENSSTDSEIEDTHKVHIYNQNTGGSVVNNQNNTTQPHCLITEDYSWLGDSLYTLNTDVT